MLCVRGTSCLFTLSASEFIEPSLCHLDFFLDIFFLIFSEGISCIAEEQWVSHFVAKGTPIGFQNCFASRGW